MKIRNALTFSLIGTLLLAGGAFAQSQPSPCVANPEAAPSDKSLSLQLDDCNGVLKPPKVGDSEIVEPAPKSGTIIVVPPGSVPDQQSESGPVEGPKAATLNGPDYSISSIVEAIGTSGETARKLQTIVPANVVIRDISILLGGSNAAVLNASLAAHSSAVDELRKVIQSQPTLSTAVSASGLSVTGIVAAQIDGQDIVTLFGR